MPLLVRDFIVMESPVISDPFIFARRICLCVLAPKDSNRASWAIGTCKVGSIFFCVRHLCRTLVLRSSWLDSNVALETLLWADTWTGSLSASDSCSNLSKFLLTTGNLIQLFCLLHYKALKRRDIGGKTNTETGNVTTNDSADLGKIVNLMQSVHVTRTCRLLRLIYSPKNVLHKEVTLTLLHCVSGKRRLYLPRLCAWQSRLCSCTSELLSQISVPLVLFQWSNVTVQAHRYQRNCQRCRGISSLCFELSIGKVRHKGMYRSLVIHLPPWPTLGRSHGLLSKLRTIVWTVSMNCFRTFVSWSSMDGVGSFGFLSFVLTKKLLQKTTGQMV